MPLTKATDRVHKRRWVDPRALDESTCTSCSLATATAPNTANACRLRSRANQFAVRPAHAFSLPYALLFHLSSRRSCALVPASRRRFPTETQSRMSVFNASSSGSSSGGSESAKGESGGSSGTLFDNKFAADGGGYDGKCDLADVKAALKECEGLTGAALEVCRPATATHSEASSCLLHYLRQESS